MKAASSLMPPVMAKAMWISVWSAAGQVVAVAMLPILTRVYSPESFGVFNYISAVCLILAAGASLRLELALPIPKDDEEASDLIRLATFSNIALTAVTTCAVAYTTIFEAGPAPLRTPTAWVLPFLVLATAQYNLWGQFQTRQQRYDRLAKRPFVQNSSTALLQFAFHWLPIGGGGLALGLLGGRVVAVWGLTRGMAGRLWHTDRATMLATLKTYRRFSASLTPSALLNVTSSYLAVLMLTQYHGTAAAGHYGIAYQVCWLPIALIGTAAGQVFTGELSKRLRTGQPTTLSLGLRSTLWLLAASLPIWLVLQFVLPSVLPGLLGSQWGRVGDAISVLALPACVTFVSTPMAIALIVCRKEKLTLALDVTRTILLVGTGLIISYMSLGWLHLICALSATQAGFNVAAWALAALTLKKQDAAMGPHAPKEKGILHEGQQA